MAKDFFTEQFYEAISKQREELKEQGFNEEQIHKKINSVDFV